jgi:predicted CopG family antitoxin
MGRATAGTMRVTISIPLNLYKRLNESEDFNWSEVASEALERYLNPRTRDKIVFAMREEIRVLKSKVEQLEERIQRIRIISQ